MPIRVDAYTTGGGQRCPGARRPPARRPRARTRDPAGSTRSTWQPLDGPRPAPAGDVSHRHRRRADRRRRRRPDDPRPRGLARASAWRSGPYTLEGELATLPGFDPGRALTRPSGEFVLLRDVRLSVRDRVRDAGAPSAHHALVNRYAVERVERRPDARVLLPGRGDGRPEVADGRALSRVARAAAPSAAERQRPLAAPAPRAGGPACGGRGARRSTRAWPVASRAAAARRCDPGRTRPRPSTGSPA